MEKVRVGGRNYGKTMNKIIAISFIIATAVIIVGCDPLTMHKVTSTIFDGVPSMPTAEQYCKDYHEKASLIENEAEMKQQQSVSQDSKHPPYVEKRCNDCHNKDTDSGFVVPADVLCAHCHKDFPMGSFLHGPAAVGSCLKCHLPHTSQNPSLLIKPKEELCNACHAEERIAKGLHTTSIGNGMTCTDCHDPHGGNVRFFLR